MEDRQPHILQRFFNYCGLSGFVLSLRTEIISSKPSIDNLVSLLYTIAFIVPLAILVSITGIIVEVLYEKFVKPKIFKDDSI